MKNRERIDTTYLTPNLSITTPEGGTKLTLEEKKRIKFTPKMKTCAIIDCGREVDNEGDPICAFCCDSLEYQLDRDLLIDALNGLQKDIGEIVNRNREKK